MDQLIGLSRGWFWLIKKFRGFGYISLILLPLFDAFGAEMTQSLGFHNESEVGIVITGGN